MNVNFSKEAMDMSRLPFFFIVTLHEKLFGTHIWLGTVGWFGMLITGFSYKMLPMFYLSHHYPTRLQRVVTILWNSGTILGAITFLFSGGSFWFVWSTLLLITLALIFYLWEPRWNP